MKESGAGSEVAQVGERVPAYKLALVSFVDILGFRERISQGQAPKDVLSVLQLLRQEATPPDELATAYEIGYTNLSDSVLRVTSLFSDTNITYRPGILFMELLELAQVQYRLAGCGVFLRGGVAIGEIFHKPPYVFGPAFNCAYELESRHAIYPRILVDRDVLEVHSKTPILRGGHHTREYDVRSVRELLAKDDRGMWFIDYLRVAGTEIYDCAEYLGYLAAHRDQIVNAQKTHEHDARVRAKYQWLTVYHNRVVEATAGDDRTTLRIGRPASWSSRIVKSVAGARRNVHHKEEIMATRKSGRKSTVMAKRVAKAASKTQTRTGTKKDAKSAAGSARTQRPNKKKAKR